MANLTAQDDFIRTALRLPRDLHARVQADAEKNSRSMNAEIISRLEGSFLPIAGQRNDELSEILALLHELIGKKKP